MAHLAILADYTMEAMVIDEWVAAEVNRPGAYAEWMGTLSVYAGMTPGSKLREWLESRADLHFDFLFLLRDEICAMGDLLVDRLHGMYFLSSSLRRAATLQLLTGYFQEPLHYRPRVLFGPSDRVLWDFMCAVGMCAYVVTKDAREAAEYGLTTLEARYVQWDEDHGRQLLPNDVPQGVAPEPESWD